MRSLRRVFASLAIFAAILLASRPAGADDVAPGLTRSDLRVFADLEVQALARAPGAAAPGQLRGIYAAIDEDPSDPRAQAACDDDGDPVVVFTEAMLQLVASLATASLADDGDERVAGYAAFTARAQARGARWLPLPARPGSAPRPSGAWEPRVRAILAFVAAREIARFRAGDLVCPRPTVTREQGDAIWTAAEARGAARTAAALYGPASRPRDVEALDLLGRIDREVDGARVLFAFFGEHARVRAVEGARGAVPTYARTHPTAPPALPGEE